MRLQSQGALQRQRLLAGLNSRSDTLSKLNLKLRVETGELKAGAHWKPFLLGVQCSHNFPTGMCQTSVQVKHRRGPQKLGSECPHAASLVWIGSPEQGLTLLVRVVHFGSDAHALTMRRVDREFMKSSGWPHTPGSPAYTLERLSYNMSNRTMFGVSFEPLTDFFFIFLHLRLALNSPAS